MTETYLRAKPLCLKTVVLLSTLGSLPFWNHFYLLLDFQYNRSNLKAYTFGKVAEAKRYPPKKVLPSDQLPA